MVFRKTPNCIEFKLKKAIIDLSGEGNFTLRDIIDYHFFINTSSESGLIAAILSASWNFGNCLIVVI